MKLVVTTPAATEPLTVSETKAFCRIDGANAEPAPGAPTVALAAPAAPGNVDNGVHRYLVTFVTAAGETEAGVPSSSVTVADKAVNGQVALTAIPLGGSAVTSRKLYRTVAGGSSFLLLAAIADNTTTAYTDNVADSALGAGAPSTNTTDDGLLAMLIAAARAAAEHELGRYLVSQTVDLHLDEFPESNEIRLPPLQSVSSVTYVDSDGATQTLAADQYAVDSVSRPARIAPAYGVTWPATRAQAGAVRVRFLAGYGAAAAVPACVKHWMLVQIKAGYDKLPPDPLADGLLDSERVQLWV